MADDVAIFQFHPFESSKPQADLTAAQCATLSEFSAAHNTAFGTTQGGFQCFQETSSFPAAWTQIDFDLTSYAGQTIQLGFSFYSDGSVTYTGPHVDDVLVAEPGAMP